MSAVAAETGARPKLGPVVIPLLALALFINYVDRGNLATAAPLIKDELKLTASQIGLLISAFSWTYVAAMPVAGWMSERFGPYRTLALGLGLWSLATLATGFATGFAMILALRMVLGLGESTVFPTSSKLIAQYVPHHRLGGVNGLVSQGLSWGPAFGVFFGGMLMADLGWRRVFLLFGALSLTWLVPWLASTSRLSAAARAAPRDAPPPSFRAILSRRELWGVALGHLAGNYGFYFVISWLPLYLVKARGFSLAEMATLSGVIYLVYAAGSYGGGWVTDRWISAGATQGMARKTVAVTGQIVGGIGLLAAAWGSPDLAIAGLVLAGFGLGAIAPHTFAAGQVLAGPNAAGKWIGTQNCIANLSGIVGPLVTGWLIDRTGGYQAAFILTAAVGLIGLVGWLALIPKIEPLDWKPA